jgi:hypothetical protein
MLPVEASALMGSLTGIAEIAKASFGEEAVRRAAGRTPNTGGGGGAS